MYTIPHNTYLHIGSLLSEGIDQIDLTRPFGVLSRIPNSTYCIYGKTAAVVRDLKGSWLTPDAALADAPPVDLLHVLGGFGQEALMEDTEVLGWICAGAALQQRQARDGARRDTGSGAAVRAHRRAVERGGATCDRQLGVAIAATRGYDLARAGPFGENRGRIGAAANGRALK